MKRLNTCTGISPCHYSLRPRPTSDELNHGTDVPFSVEQVMAQGGCTPLGSSPTSFTSMATTPCGGTSVAVKFRTAVPLSVCVHRSCRNQSTSIHRVTQNSRHRGRTRIEYCLPARIHGDSINWNVILSAVSFVFS